jgi:hypothetical protein
MALIDLLNRECSIIEGKNLIHFYTTFIDYIIMIWVGTVAQFEEFMFKIKCLHQTIKFRFNYDHENKSVKFLDTTINYQMENLRSTANQQIKSNTSSQILVTQDTF